MTDTKSIIRSVGSYLPARVITNDDLAKTGRHLRRVDRRSAPASASATSPAEGETTSDLAAAARRKALANAGIDVGDIDLIIVATTTPDMTFPATAARGAAEARHAPRRRLRHSGGVLRLRLCAWRTADRYLKNGLAQARPGDRRRDRLAHPRLDRSHHLRAVRRRRRRGGAGTRRGRSEADRGVLATALCSDGQPLEQALRRRRRRLDPQPVGHVRMQGQDVFKHAVGDDHRRGRQGARGPGYTIDDLDWFVPHQANKRIIDGTGCKLGLPPEKVVVTVDRHANTSAASVPLALTQRVADGRIKRGDLVMIEAMGGGFTWGASLIRW